MPRVRVGAFRIRARPGLESGHAGLGSALVNPQRLAELLNELLEKGSAEHGYDESIICDVSEGGLHEDCLLYTSPSPRD